VAFTDAETGWALGSGRYVGSTVVATINGGQTWNTLTLPSGVEVSDLAAADRLHVWACGKKNDRAAVLASTDGGATWALRRPGSTDAFSGITFINVMRGWVVGDDGGIFATTDGGASWKPQWSRTAADLRDVTFVGRKLGWAVGAKTKVDAGVVVATRDGGLTWTVQSRADWAGGLNHVEFADSTHGWAFGSFNDDEMPVVVATRDSGATWEAQGLPSSIRQVGGAAFQDSRRGWLAGSANSGLVLSTTDGGSSPTLKSVTPLRGRRGTTVTLTGSGLGDTQSVEFGGRPATFSVLADDTVRVVLPYYPGGRVPIFVSTSTHTMVAVRLFTVLVRPRISLRLEGLSGGAFMRLGGRLRVWGSVGPLSCEGERVRLPVQHRQGSRWRRVARPAATVKYGSFGPVSFKPAARGAYRIKAAMERTVLHPASWTRWFPFEVK
jgi:photosystem II stability/assembly factor-like uncharacterized protein